jgi:lambda repressor-like predicted transcriptional regulator
MTNKLVTLQNQVNKAKLSINTLHEAFERGTITLSELVACELEVGKKYSLWAENIDKQALKDKQKKEKTLVPDKVESLFNSSQVGEFSWTKNHKRYHSHKDLMIPPVNDDRYTPEEFCEKYGPSSLSFYDWKPDGVDCIHDWKVEDCYVCLPTGD